jgi:hypothetical protein
MCGRGLAGRAAPYQCAGALWVSTPRRAVVTAAGDRGGRVSCGGLGAVPPGGAPQAARTAGSACPPPRGRERRRYSNTQPLKQHAIAELDHDPTGSKWARRCDIPKAVPQLLSPRTCALVSAKTAWSLALRKHQRGPAIWHARAVMDRLSSFFSLGVVGRDGGTRTVSTAAALPGASNS